MTGVVPDEDCTEGTGNSPPARKLAVSPDSATRSGSARLRINPFLSNALIITSTVVPALTRLASATPNGADELRPDPANAPIDWKRGIPAPVTGFPCPSTPPVP